MLLVTRIFVSVIRVNREVRAKLEELKRKTGVKSMSELIKILIEISEKELDKFKGDPKVFLRTLKAAGEAGRYDSERVDEILYGEKS